MELPTPQKPPVSQSDKKPQEMSTITTPIDNTPESREPRPSVRSMAKGIETKEPETPTGPIRRPSKIQLSSQTQIMVDQIQINTNPQKETPVQKPLELTQGPKISNMVAQILLNANQPKETPVQPPELEITQGRISNFVTQIQLNANQQKETSVQQLPELEITQGHISNLVAQIQSNVTTQQRTTSQINLSPEFSTSISDSKNFFESKINSPQ